MVDDTEAELVRRITRGDTAAYRKILDSQLGPVNRYVTRMLNSGPEAEDITQEVFLRLWTQADRFNPATARLSTWLHNIAHNLCVDFFRKQGRLVEEFPEESESGEEPDAQLLAARSANDIREALARLPERQRSAIIMSHYQGLSNKETAEILSMSVDALESLLARGRRALRKMLQERDL